MSHEFEPNETGSVLDSGSLISEDNGKQVLYHEPRSGELVSEDLPREPDHKGFELIDGEWIEKPMSNTAAIVESNLDGQLFNHIRPTRSGLLMTGNAAYRLPNSKNRIRKPDLSFVATGRTVPSRDDDGSWPIAPDLAIEVISPNELAEEVETKLNEYLRAGVRLVWILYIPTKNVWAYKQDGTAKLYRSTDLLVGEDVLPGFSVPVGELFEEV
jgi:Uma2 family endonuclease